MQLIEHIFVRESEDVEKFYETKKYWQAQLSILTNVLNNTSEWCALDRVGYSKSLLKTISNCFIIYNYNLSWELHLLMQVFCSILIVFCIKEIIIVKLITLFCDQEHLEI